ncbi:MAG TPA: malto-oligosyltrehalose trehalohydrolase, partial [Rhodoglobus sp.]|nr:malto-oligosyltrehalose trehalohydrolase [Rhodoglobus sp.]
MTMFEVWGPRVERMRVQVDGTAHDMERDADGFWRAEVPTQGDVDYGFLLDDDEHPVPDPRSRRQPEGVHGLSRTFDPAQHDWQDGDWRGIELRDGIVYELHLGTFTPEGTFDAA